MAVIAFRAIEERPVVGGEKFSAVIGPAPAFRLMTRTTLALSLLSLAGAVLGGLRGWLFAGALLFAAACASGWISGGPEELVCQGGGVRHRRGGPLRDRGRVLPLRDLRSIDAPDRAGRRGLAGVRLTTSAATLVVGRGLALEDALALAAALRSHVASRDLPHAVLSAPPPERAGRPGSLERIRARR